MTIDRLIRMGLRMLMRHGVSRGVDHMARKGRRPEEMTAAELAAWQRNRQSAGKARRNLGLLRRFLR